MKLATLSAAALLALCAGSAGAQSFDGTTTIVCLDVSGRIIPAACQVPASRIEAREDICSCPVGGERVVAPVCPSGVSPPAESAAFASARRAAATHGTLVGATFQGAPMCVAPRNSRGSGG